MQIDKNTLLNRFSAYVRIDTTSDDRSKTFPSALRELDLARFLVDELLELGLSEVEMTEHGYVLASLPANDGGKSPVIGLVAHMDTSCEASGANVQVEVHEKYNGGDIQLSPNAALRPADFPELLNYVGQDIITSDGTTLLGADDKAGICAIITACEYLLAHPEVKHGKLRLAFTPDEEIGRGTEHFPLERFGADFAYTVDGGAVGELNYETFNACNAHITFHGVSVHPGSAKNKMRNAVTMAAEWQMALPAGERPEYTEGYEGFYHSLRIEGGTDKVELDMILRDHDKKILEQRKEFLLNLTRYMQSKYGAGTVECSLKDCYSNMREYIMPVYEIVERAENAMRAAGVEPILVPVRGGTDGSLLSAMGLPCPNLFTGGHNFHGRFEYLPLQSLQKITEVLVHLVTTEK
ncbi:peptidase T [Phascolarctobacterium sp.]|uniref:peptidase T n=1 Tax=Phascolarctobacterium sp. TaxID=2049039 RepID=UPI00386BA6E6